METIYFTTSNFIRHQGNLVDLTEYRRKLARAQGEPEEPKQAEKPRPIHTRRRRSGLVFLGLDYAASVALIVTALAFMVKIL